MPGPVIPHLDQASSPGHVARASEQFLLQALDSIPTPVGILDEVGTILWVNRAWPPLHDGGEATSPWRSVGSRFLDGFAGAGDETVPPPILAQVENVITGQRREFREENAFRTNGGRWVEVHASRVDCGQSARVLVAVKGKGPDLPRGAGGAIDPADSTLGRAPDALHDSEQTFRNALENAPIGMALVGLDGRWLMVNRALCEIVGYDGAELFGLTFQDITHPDDLDSDLAHVQELLRGESESYRMEKRYIHKDGTEVWIQLSASIVRTAQGQPLYFIAQIENIAPRKQSEAERDRLLRSLELEQARLRGVLDALPVGVFITDETGLVLVTNPAASRIWGGDTPLVGPEGYGLYRAWRADTGEALTPEDWPIARAVRLGEAIVDQEVEILGFDGGPKDGTGVRITGDGRARPTDRGHRGEHRHHRSEGARGATPERRAARGPSDADRRRRSRAQQPTCRDQELRSTPPPRSTVPGGSGGHRDHPSRSGSGRPSGRGASSGSSVQPRGRGAGGGRPQQRGPTRSEGSGVLAAHT